MNGISTITQKGQVAIPKDIRDYFGLKPSDKVAFTVEDGKIVAKKVSNVDDMLGIVSAKTALSKKDTKALIRSQVLRKYESRS